MESKFLKLYNIIIKCLHNNSIFVENINDVYKNSKFLIYEKNFILPIPNSLYKTVKNLILNLIEKNDYQSEIKIDLKTALFDNFMKEFDEDGLYSDLLKLFKNKDNAYFSIKIEGKSGTWSNLKGEFKLPKEFLEINSNSLNEQHFSGPKIQVLSITKNTEKAKKEYLNVQKLIKSKYDQIQKSIEIFKENILNFNNFGTIIIYPTECTQDDDNIDLPTLNEAIEHECQHLCIFLLSIAKTCAEFGLHFSNNLQKSTFKYELKESEFITLFGSYCNILIRIYNKIKEPKNHINFIKTVLDLSIKNETNQDQKYVNILNSSLQFSRIKEFYKSIYQDKNFKFNELKYENNKLIKVPAIKFNNKKFNKLVNWTIKNFEENLKNG